MKIFLFLFLGIFAIIQLSCTQDTSSTSNEDNENPTIDNDGNQGTITTENYKSYLTINLQQLDNYVGIAYPAHYASVQNQTNTPTNNAITNAGAMLGRVLFFDKNLSVNNSISCASCHLQSHAFDDSSQFSLGFEGGTTDAHAMRLLNAQFYLGEDFFWDRRAPSLESQTTQPIQNSVEMGFDATHGGFSSLITKMNELEYYPELFAFVFGSSEITENRVQRALAQYIREMVSTTSKFDTGYAQVFNPNIPNGNVGMDFPNFTNEENLGKALFVNPPTQGGVGCIACHPAPSFALVENSRSNGLDMGETTIFKAPSLKSVALSTHFMHDGRFTTLAEVIEHYNSGIQPGPALDNRLNPGGNPLRLNLTQEQKNALVAFLETLTDLTTPQQEKFNDPFL